MRGDPRSAGARGGTESQPLRQDMTRSFTRGELLAPRLRGAPRPGGFTVSSPAPPLPSTFHFNFSSFSNLCIPSPGGEVARLRPHAPLPPGQETQGGGAATAFRAHQPAPCWRVAGPVAGDPHCRPILSTSSSLSLLIFDPGHVLHFIMHLS